MVLTDNGPKSLDQISTGDRLLGYNFETNHPEFTKV